MSDATIREIWLLSLALYGVVLLVVAALLTMILVTATRIHAGVSDIWTAGQKIANNTVHIAMLDTTNHLLGTILGSAKGIVTATSAVSAHASNCPGCPQCVLGGGGR